MLKRILFYLFISMLFFGLLLKIEYATDTYAVFNFDKKEIFMQYAMSGRFITALIGKVIKEANISEKTIYMSSYILAIVCTVFSQYILYTIIEKNVKSRVLKLITPILIIINPFSIELFLYIEKGVMWFGVLMCIISVKTIIKFFETKNHKYIFLAIIQMFIANSSYQGVAGIFVSVSLVFILKYSKNIKQFIINNFLVGSIYSISAILDFLMIKLIFKTSRINGQIDLVKSLKIIFKNTIEMYIKTYNLLQKNTFILLILFTFGVVCCKIWKEKKYLHILSFIYIVVGITLFAIVPQIIQPTDSIWFVPRSTFSFATMYGILVLYLLMNYNLEIFLKNLIIIISSFLILFQVQTFTRIEKDRYIVNKKDKDVTMQIIGLINNYEKQTGNKVEFISIYHDKEPQFTYDNIFATGDINIKCYFANWSSVEILNYYLHRNLNLSENDKEREQKLKKMNWDEFNKEQIDFKKNKINICNY